MSTFVSPRFRHPVANSARSGLPWLGSALAAAALAFAARQPPDRALEALDPVFMQAVQASISQRDVQAILASQAASGPVHLQLVTACDADHWCTIVTTMDFPRSVSRPEALSLQLAMQVAPDDGNTVRTVRSVWEVRSGDPAHRQHIDRAGDLRELGMLADSEEGTAIAGVLNAIHSSIAHVLLDPRTGTG